MSELRNATISDSIFDMIRQVEYEDTAFQTRLLSEPHEQRNSFRYWVARTLKDVAKSDRDVTEKKCYRIIVEAATEYVLTYPAPITAKQKLFQKMYALCEAIGEQCEVPDYELFLKDMPAPVDQDLTIGIIKNLHNRNGITKSEIADEYGVSTKTAQTMLRRLTGKSKSEALRIGGQLVRIDVDSHKKRSRDEEQRFYTRNSMTPIVLQMNLMQVATLLQSFYYNYEKGNMIPLDMAISVWCQLSDYAKKRVKEVFCLRDLEFSEFIDMVDKESESDEYHFMTETEMLKEGDSSPKEQLMLAFKGGIICDITLTGPYRSRKRQRIFYDFDRDSYYAVGTSKCDNEKLYFNDDELRSLTESVD